MGIRMTNQIMMNNTMNNINRNKIAVDKVTTQMSTGQKISRASEDPIIAIRALRYKTNINELEQFKSNIDDAQSWMKFSQTALENIYKCVSETYNNCVNASTGTYSTSQYQALLDEMNSLREQVYAEGNATYADRSLLTGYKTNMDLAFSEQDSNAEYTITEKLTPADMDTISYIYGDLSYSKDSILATTDTEYDSTSITMSDIYRFRLAYTDLTPVSSPATLEYVDASGTQQTMELVTKSLGAGADQAYTPETGKIVFIPETGELIYGEDMYSTVQSWQSMSFTYDKKGFNKGDLHPEHYFDCTNKLNEEKYQYVNENVTQAIEYRVNFNQTLQVNIEAKNVFDHSIGRDMDDVIGALSDLVDIEEKIAEIETMLKDEQYADKTEYLNSMLDAANKEHTYRKEKFTKLTEGMLTNFKGYMDDITKATTDLASRQSRLDLTSERVTASTSNMKELASNNIGVDEADVIIEQSSAELAYESALTATSKIMGVNLLNFI